MKKYTITPVLMLVAMTVQLHAAHILTAARAFTRIPAARQLSTAAQPGSTLPEPVGTDWNEYAQDWDEILDNYNTITINYMGYRVQNRSNVQDRSNNVQKKIRILNALMRNHKLMVPPTLFNSTESCIKNARDGALGGSILGGGFGLLVSLLNGVPFVDAVALTAVLGGCGCIGLAAGAALLGVSPDYFGAKFDTYHNRRDYKASLTKAKNTYNRYLQNPELVSEHYKKGLIEPLGPIVKGPLPREILLDLYEESKREGRIQE